MAIAGIGRQQPRATFHRQRRPIQHHRMGQRVLNDIRAAWQHTGQRVVRQRRARAIDIARLDRGAGRDLGGADIDEGIARDTGADRRLVQHRDSVGTLVVLEDVARDGQRRTGIRNALATEMHQIVVRPIRPFFDDVVGDHIDAAIWQIDLIAGVAGWPVGEDIPGDGVGQRAAFQFMPLDRAFADVVGEGQRGDRADIRVMRVTRAGPVIIKQTVIDGDGIGGQAGDDGKGQDAILVTDEGVIFQYHDPAFIADARAIPAVGDADRRALETDILNENVVVDGQNALRIGRRDGGHQVDHAANADDRDAVADGREIVGIGSGININGGPVDRRRDRGGQGRKFLSHTDRFDGRSGDRAGQTGRGIEKLRKCICFREEIVQRRVDERFGGHHCSHDVLSCRKSDTLVIFGNFSS